MTEQPSLVIAAHGTRDAEGAQVALDLVAKVQTLLPDVDVSAGFVELTPPTIDEALASALAKMTDPRAVVVPLMIGTGGHVQRDIPEAITEGRSSTPNAEVVYSGHLGADPRMVARLRHQVDEARGDWEPEQTTVVMVGRGALVPDANADHVRLSRMLFELGGYRSVEPCFIQVTAPDLPTGLERARQTGADRIVVMPHFLFPGVLRTWVRERSMAWQAKHPEVEVRLAEVLGACDEVAQVVVDRYLASTPQGAPSYLAGLNLEGRDVLMVGGGSLAARRIPALLSVGARIRVVAPELDPQVSELAASGAIQWTERAFQPEDCNGAWYVLALTSDPDVNALVAQTATEAGTFVVRADRGSQGTAVTPATARLSGMTVGVVSGGRPTKSMQVRDDIVKLLKS